MGLHPWSAGRVVQSFYRHPLTHTWPKVRVPINVAENLGQTEKVLLIKASGNDGTLSVCKVVSTKEQPKQTNKQTEI